MAAATIVSNQFLFSSNNSTYKVIYMAAGFIGSVNYKLKTLSITVLAINKISLSQ